MVGEAIEETKAIWDEETWPHCHILDQDQYWEYKIQKELLEIGKTQLPMTKEEEEKRGEEEERRRKIAKETVPKNHYIEVLNKQIFKREN